MTKDELILTQIIKSVLPEKLAKLVSRYGYPRQTVTPALLERIFEESGEPFAQEIRRLLNESKQLNRISGWAPKDINQTVSTGSDLIKSIFGSLDLGGVKKSEAEVARWKAEAEASKAASNPWPWIIGGVVVVTLIVILVTNKNK